MAVPQNAFNKFTTEANLFHYCTCKVNTSQMKKGKYKTNAMFEGMGEDCQ